jgi:preprotein translocase subunit YajC
MAAPGGQGSIFGDQLVLILVIFAIFYFIVFRPMRKRQRETEEMLGALKNGDRVVTNGGIYGTVVGVADDIIQLRIADHVKIQVAKSAIARLASEPGKQEKKG